MAEAITPKEIDMTEYHPRDLSRARDIRRAWASAGPPKSRIRRIIAPPMEKVESPTSQPGGVKHLPPGIDQKKKTFIMPGVNPTETELSCSDWIAARKAFRQQLDNTGDVVEYLSGKPVLTESESRVKQRMLRERSKSLIPPETSSDRGGLDGMLGEKVKRPSSRLTTADMAKDNSVKKSPQCWFTTPAMQTPSPDGLGVVDKYLHQRHLRLVDLYNQTDKAKKKLISVNDFKAVRKEAELPIRDAQVEDMIVSLSDNTPNSVTYKELSRGRSAWRKENTEEHFKNIGLKPAAKFHTVSPGGQKPLDASAQFAEMRPDDIKCSQRGSSSTCSEQREGTSSSRFLKLPPIDLDEKRPLNFEDMEDAIKHYRDQKRRGKGNTQPEHWLDQGRTIRTWNDAVDAHSQPSTLGEETGEKVDKYRMKCLWQYHEILKLCRIYNVPLTEELLERALLYPGDRWVHPSGQPLKIRQPGTAAFSTKDVPKKHPDSGIAGKPQRGAPAHTPYPPNTYVKSVKARVRGNAKNTKETLDCWVTFEQFQGMICNLKRRHPYRFRTIDESAFWPGHLLDKLRIYLPSPLRHN